MKTQIKQMIRGLGHMLLGPLERRLLKRHGGQGAGPHIFILGAPRSGTSLFYELLVTRYHFSFFSNLSHRFFRTPVAASRLGKRIIERRQGSFNSDYGHISGWSAPNEGGWIWQRWLADGDWQDERALDTKTAPVMQTTLNALSAVFDAPFVNKNVMHSNRVRLLDALFPGCLFIEVRRDAKDTARSIIRAQLRDRGPDRHDDEWWSVRPSSAGQGASYDLLERSCLQVAGVAADIAHDTDHLGQGRLFPVDYAAFCKDPKGVLQEVAAFLKTHNVELKERADIPVEFNPPPSKPFDAEEEARLDRMFEKLEAGDV